MSFVLDAALALAWCFEGAADRYAGHVFRLLAAGGARVPATWPLEVANGLLIGERRGRLTEAQVAHFVATLEALPIAVEAGGLPVALTTVRALARAHRLTAYDAAYLELAAREGLPLATLDAGLRAAAGRLGVALVADEGMAGR